MELRDESSTIARIRSKFGFIVSLFTCLQFFNTSINFLLIHKKMVMTRCEPQTSGFGSDQSADCATAEFSVSKYFICFDLQCAQ